MARTRTLALALALALAAAHCADAARLGPLAAAKPSGQAKRRHGKLRVLAIGDSITQVRFSYMSVIYTCICML